MASDFIEQPVPFDNGYIFGDLFKEEDHTFIDVKNNMINLGIFLNGKRISSKVTCQKDVDKFDLSIGYGIILNCALSFGYNF